MAYYYANRDAVRAHYKNLPDDIKELRRARTRAWRAANKELKAIYDKRWRETHPGEWRALHKKHSKTPQARFIRNLRRRLRDFVRAQTSRISADFGCTPKQLRQHVEAQFRRGMTWANYGQWHIDHIVPCAAFDLNDPQQARLCFNWQNLRPAWADDNIAKSNKLTFPQLRLPLSLIPI